MAEALVGLGGNLGERRTNLRRGLLLLEPEIDVLVISALYESAPMGITDQPYFLNAALLGETSLEPLALLEKLKAVEWAVGRRAGKRWGPRLLDLDLLTYDDVVLVTERLTIPHPRIQDRSFVLQPLVDLQPERTLPGWTETLEDALRTIGSTDLRRLAGPEWADR